MIKIKFTKAIYISINKSFHIFRLSLYPHLRSGILKKFPGYLCKHIHPCTTVEPTLATYYFSFVPTSSFLDFFPARRAISTFPSYLCFHPFVYFFLLHMFMYCAKLPSGKVIYSSHSRNKLCEIFNISIFDFLRNLTANRLRCARKSKLNKS